MDVRVCSVYSRQTAIQIMMFSEFKKSRHNFPAAPNNILNSLATHLAWRSGPIVDTRRCSENAV